MSSLVVAVLQTCATPDKARNLDRAEQLLRAAHAGSGARLLVLPEVFNWRGRPADERSAAEPVDGPTVARMGAVAKSLGAWVLLGSMLESSGSAEPRPFNTSVLLDPTGAARATYRKIHLFDVLVEGHGAVRESATRAPGDRATYADLPAEGAAPAVRLGLSVCYDLRFPELYRKLSEAGAHVLAVPAAFTARTGRDHWLALLRARAIENLSWVVAANQWGSGGDSIESYGRSCVIDPWGTVVATCPDGEGWVAASVDLAQQKAIRERFPALTHRRADVAGKPATDGRRQSRCS